MDMKPVCTKLVLILTLLFVVPSFAADGAPSTKAPATKVAPKPDAAAPVAAPEEKPTADKPTEKKSEETKEDTQKWWQGLLVTIIEAFVAIVAPILSILLMVLIRKWNLKIEQQKVDWVLDKSLGFGEQKLKKLLKDDNPPEDPDSIKQAALEHGTKLLEKYGLARKLGGWMADGIEARLGQKVVEAGGAKKVVNGV
jgi:hypothetical protein